MGKHQVLPSRRRERELKRWIKTLGIDEARVVAKKGKHPKVLLSYEGREGAISVPGTPGSFRSEANTRSRLRKLARGLKGEGLQ